jgi:sugar phosphate isomerase/epimerase
MRTDSGPVSRRDLLRTAAAGATAVMATVPLIGCASSSHATAGSAYGGVDRTKRRARLGLDTYSLHRTLTAKDVRHRHDLWWVLDHLETLGLSGLQIDPSHFPGNDEATLARLESIVRPRGYYIEFAMGGWDAKRLAERIKLTARFHGKAVRTFCGDERATPAQIETFLKWAPPALREASHAADEYQVDIAVENHGDLTAVQLRELLDRVGHPRVGACFDTGNSLFRQEDPVVCAKTLAAYARSMHLKDWTMRRGPDGGIQWSEAVLGHGQIPVREVLAVILAARPDLYIAVETPVRPSNDEAETVQREWRHVTASAAAARRLLADLSSSGGDSEWRTP